MKTILTSAALLLAVLPALSAPRHHRPRVVCVQAFTEDTGFHMICPPARRR